MKIAITTENGNVFQHFGQSQTFTIYEIEDSQLKNKILLDSSQNGHSALAGLLFSSAVDVVICGGIGGGARNMLEASGIRVMAGVEGRADDAVKAFLSGELNDLGPTCNHHDHEHSHECSCHSHCT